LRTRGCVARSSSSDQDCLPETFRLTAGSN
jgi:hypothetical protein